MARSHAASVALPRLRRSLALLVLLGCGDSGSPTEPSSGPAPVASVTVSGAPANGIVLMGMTVQLVATLRDAAGNALNDRALTWRSSDTTVARVDANGSVTSIAAGRAKITATAESQTATVQLDFRAGGTVGPDGSTLSVLGDIVTIVAPAGAVTQSTVLTVGPSSLPHDPDMIGVAYDVGPDSFAFAKPVFVRLGYPVPLASGLTEGSLQLYVRTGNAWAVVPGSSVDIFAHAVTGAVSRTGTFAVLATRVASVTITGVPTGSLLYVGKTAQLSATAYDVAGNALTGRAVTWSSSDTTVLRVSSVGLLTPVAPGTALITALAEGKTAAVPITVALPPVGTVSVAPATIVTYAGLPTQATATVKDTAGAVMTGRAVKWTSSNSAAAQVDSTGRITAVAAGSATVTASAGGKTASVTVTVKLDQPADCSQLAEWTTYQGNASHNGCVPLTLTPGSFAERWVVTVDSGVKLNPLTTSGSEVFVSTTSYFGTQRLSALDAATGMKQWEYDFGNIHSVDPPAYDNGTVYVQTGGHEDSYLYAFNAASGTVRFRTPYGNQWSPWYAPVVVDGAVVAAGGYYGGMYSFDTQTGSVNWFQSALNQYDEWTPSVHNGRAYAYTGSYSPKLSVLNAATGAVLYEIADPHFSWNGWSMNVSPVLGGANDVVATQGGRLLAFDLTNRTVKWEHTGGFTGDVAVASGTLYVVANGQVEAHRETDGSLQWIWIPPEGKVVAPMIVTNNLLFVSTSANTYAVDLSSHAQVWVYPHAGSLALSKAGVLYVAQSDGKVAAVALQ